MRRLVLLGLALTAAAILPGLSVPSTAAAEGAQHPFTREGSTAALEDKITEDFPGSIIPGAEGRLCSAREFSLMTGPVFFCFAEFTIEGTWNLVAASRPFAAMAEPGGASVSIDAHTAWTRRWRRCHLGRGTPGTLFSNEDCGRRQLEPLSETDGEPISFEVLPRLKVGKPVRFVNRDLPYGRIVPSISRFRASLRNGVYTFTNSLGDSFRYRPPKRLGAVS